MYKVGQKVKLRNGDTAIITGTLKGSGKLHGIATSQEDYEYVQSWNAEDGKVLIPMMTAEDIVEVVQVEKKDRVVAAGGFRYPMPLAPNELEKGRAYWAINLRNIHDRRLITCYDEVPGDIARDGLVFKKRSEAASWLKYLIISVRDTTKKLRINPDFFPRSEDVKFYEYEGVDLDIPANDKFIAYDRHGYIFTSKTEMEVRGEEWVSDTAVFVGSLGGFPDTSKWKESQEPIDKERVR